MDPQSQAFTPYPHSSNSTSSDTFRLQNDVTRIQQVQAEHTDRILRLERRQGDDTRIKSVWGSQSPFPSVLSGGTPQQAPLQHPPGDQFRSFDEEASTLMSSLHLDADEEPRRALGTTSRANSVRFDESANQNHFSHSSRPSAEFLSRTNSGLGALQMTERSSSHKSEGRASSAHSIRSLASGRANSLNLDSTIPGLGDLNRSLLEAPGIAPGLMLLGPAPAIIRCWMNTNFKHDALLYAAVCTGSYKSFLDAGLIKKLGFEALIRTTSDGFRIVELPMYFPEAVPHPACSHSSNPAPSLPSLMVEFRITENTDQEESKAIQIFLGSDVLQAHNAGIMFSSNNMTMYDDDGNKLSIPFARPENEAAFNSLMVVSGNFAATTRTSRRSEAVEVSAREHPYLNGLGRSSSAASSVPSEKHHSSAVLATETKPAAIGSDRSSRPASRNSTNSRPNLSILNTNSDREEIQAMEEAGAQTAILRSGSSPAVQGSWRRDGIASAAATSQPSSGLDWASLSRNREQSYQRKDTGIKVLKPKTASRTLSTTAATPTASSPSDGGKSRFFDEGRRRSVGESSAMAKTTTNTKENATSSPTGPVSTAQKTKANPVGGASAFSWLNSSRSK